MVDDEVFTFGSFRLIPAGQLLLEDEKPLRLGSRALEILIALVERAGETVLKDQLIGRVWPSTVVEEGALRVHVAALRKALGDGRGGNRFIANIPGRGYSFVAPVTREIRQEATVTSSRAALSGNLPVSLTRVIGRGDTVETVVSRVAQRRFLTIVGPGGIGKTTVAIAAAEAMSASYADGVWFAGLAALADATLVPGAVGAALGMAPTDVDPLQALPAWLRRGSDFGRGGAEGGAARLHSCDQSRAAAGRGRMAAAPALARSAVGTGPPHRGGSIELSGRPTVQRSGDGDDGQFCACRFRCP